MIISHFHTLHIGLQWGRPVEAENTSRMPQVLVRGQERGGHAPPWFAVSTTRRCSECAVAKLFFPRRPGVAVGNGPSTSGQSETCS